MFIVLSSSRATGTLFVTNTKTDDITEVTAEEYFRADKNLGLAVGYAKARVAEEFRLKGDKL